MLRDLSLKIGTVLPVFSSCQKKELVDVTCIVLVGAKEGSHSSSALGYHPRSGDPREISALCKPTMDTSNDANPILPAPGVSRNHALSTEASRCLERQNDDVALNRDPRRVASENSGRSRALLHCKDTLILGTYNVNTLRDGDRQLELQFRCQQQHIGILGVQEHHIIHTDPIEYRTIGTSTVVTSSGWRNEAQASQGGVGLLLDRKARKALLKAAPSASKRILVAEFDGNPKTTVIVFYAPTNCVEEEDIQEFYTDLRTSLQNVPAHNFLACLCDANARLGPEHVPHPFHKETNRGERYLVELLAEFGLIAVSTQFSKRPGKLWTFRDRTTDSRRQLDYILVRKKWRNSVHNAEAYNTLSTVKSDHRVVCARVKLSLRVSKTPKKVKYDWT